MPTKFPGWSDRLKTGFNQSGMFSRLLEKTLNRKNRLLLCLKVNFHILGSKVKSENPSLGIVKIVFSAESFFS